MGYSPENLHEWSNPGPGWEPDLRPGEEAVGGGIESVPKLPVAATVADRNAEVLPEVPGELALPAKPVNVPADIPAEGRPDGNGSPRLVLGGQHPSARNRGQSE